MNLSFSNSSNNPHCILIFLFNNFSKKNRMWGIFKYLLLEIIFFRQSRIILLVVLSEFKIFFIFFISSPFNSFNK